MAKLGIIAIILAVTLAGQVHAAGLGQSPQIGLFGTVTEVSGNHPRAVAGETDITLETESGLVEFSATEATTVRMKKWRVVGSTNSLLLIMLRP